MKIRSCSSALAPLGFGLVLSCLPAPAGTITWQDPFEVTAAADIKNPPGSTVIIAFSFHTSPGPDDGIINGIPITLGAAEVPDVFTSNMTSGPAAGGGTFFTGTTDDPDLTQLLDSHSYNGGDPGNAIMTLLGLDVGATYQVQLVAVADDRDCCAGRVYEPDDGNGVFETGKTLQRGLHQTIIGTFTATSATQNIQLRSLGGAAGNSDPGLTGLFLFRTGSAQDTDGDGLPNAWETAYGLNPSVSDSNGNGTPDGQEDGDADGLNNLAELQKGTDPTKSDTDADGFKDGVETGTGEWKSVNDTGTHPLNPDTDGDGLLDGAENFDLANGSSPHLTDTDGDLFSDIMEVEAGSNPKDGNSTPYGVKIESLGTGTEVLLQGDATDPENDGDDTLGGQGVGFNWLEVTSTTGAAISFDGEGALSVFDNRVGGGTDKWCCNGAPQDLIVKFVAPLALTHFTIASGNDVPGRDPSSFSIAGSNDGVEFTSIFEYNGTASLWTQRLEVLKFTLTTPAPQYQYIRYMVNSQSGDALHQIAEIEYFGTSTDTDGDGMPDAYEDANGLSKGNSGDRNTDKDGDGLINYEEYTKGTNPQAQDTDGDGLSDKVETRTGEWGGVSSTGTNPLVADTDGDGLSDGVENPEKPFTGPTQTGTDPNKRDTDGDFFGDAQEVEAGSNPADPDSRPGGIVIEVLGTGTESLLGGDLTDPENDGDDSGGGEGVNFNWTSVTVNGGSATFDAEGPLCVFDNRLGEGSDKWCCGGAPQDLTVEFAQPVSLTHFTISSANDVPGRDPNIWSISGSNDGENFTSIAEFNGTQGLWAERLQVVKFTLGTPSPAYKYIRYTLTAQSGDALAQVGEIEYFGTTGTAPAGTFNVTGFSRNATTGAITLTWVSTPGKNYAIEYSTNLSSFPDNLGATIPAAADPAVTTSHTFANPSPAAQRLFFRVRQQ